MTLKELNTVKRILARYHFLCHEYGTNDGLAFVLNVWDMISERERRGIRTLLAFGMLRSEK